MESKIYMFDFWTSVYYGRNPSTNRRRLALALIREDFEEPRRSLPLCLHTSFLEKTTRTVFGL